MKKICEIGIGHILHIAELNLKVDLSQDSWLASCEAEILSSVLFLRGTLGSHWFSPSHKNADFIYFPLSFFPSLCSSSFTPFLFALGFTHLSFLFFLLLSTKLECCRSHPKIGCQDIYSLTLIHVPANEFCTVGKNCLYSPQIKFIPIKKVSQVLVMRKIVSSVVG